jgi:hypothetical protein
MKKSARRVKYSDHLNTGIVLYSHPPNTRPSGIRMVIFRTLFKSGFQMVKWHNLAAILFLAYENRTFFVRFSNGEN